MLLTEYINKQQGARMSLLKRQSPKPYSLKEERSKGLEENLIPQSNVFLMK